jgi:hypothetical protein
LLSLIKHPKNFWTGAIFLAFGIAAVVIARDYSMGQAAKMGPAYFPTILGWLLIVIGAIGVVRSFFVEGEPIEKFAIRELVIILGAVMLFGVLIRGAGLAPAIMVLVILSAWAAPQFRWVGTVILALGLTIGSVLVFVKLLGLPIPVFGPWLGF